MPETRIDILLATVSHRPSATDSEPLIPERLVPGTTGCTLLVALLVLTAFSGALTQAEFLSDDWVFLYESQSWTQIFSVGIGYHYVPVFLLYLKLLQAGVGLDAAWFGAGNLLLHATNAVLLGTIARTFTRDAALGLTVSLVYCTHALVNEGVF